MKRDTAMENARWELSKMIAKSRVQRALRSYVPGAATTDLETGSEVLVFWERGNAFEGLYQILDVSDKIVHLDIDVKPNGSPLAR